MNKSTKIKSFFLLGVMVTNTLFPTTAYALTSGPSSPEFSSFEPVATTNMVNEFTGEFTYNLPLLEVPGPEGSGYPLSLSYHSGTSPEEEASWVGYGWTLNPGAINRNKKGYPDDYKGAEVTNVNDVPANWTASLGGSAGGFEIFGFDGITAGLNAAIRYNNYKGFGYTAGLSFGIKGVGSLGYSVTDGEGSYSYQVNVGEGISKYQKDEKTGEYIKTQKYKDRSKKQSALSTLNKMSGGYGSSYGLMSKNWDMRSTTVSSYTGVSFNISGSILGAFTGIPGGPIVGISGSYSRQNPTDIINEKAFGYLYTANAGTSDLQDYYAEKESHFNKRDLFLSIPFSNADDYTLLGEGLGGSFRARSQKAGHFRPNSKRSPTTITNIGMEFEVGGNNGGGTDIGVGEHILKVNEWLPNSHKFVTNNQSDETFAFRFKNDLGGNILMDSDDKPKSADLDGDELPVPAIAEDAIFSNYNSTQESGRTGRSSYIGYNTNKDMVNGTDASFKSYSKEKKLFQNIQRSGSQYENSIGEFTTTNEDGMIYTFGLPVYARNEVNRQFNFKNVSPANIQNNYLIYSNPNNDANIKGKVGSTSADPYATTYLLTSIFSPDYIDRTLNGPTKDDFGSFTRFAYNKIHDDYKWRIPYNGYLYNRNELSNKKDDAATVSYGEKEIYYLDTIETKTHFAVFVISDRFDGIDANNQESNAGLLSTALGSNLLKELDRIELYAKPVSGTGLPKKLQTVHFVYDYFLMPNLPNSIAGSKGKLTLRKVYTEYGDVESPKISPFEFKYEYDYTTAIYPVSYLTLQMDNLQNQNPDYDKFSLDAWGSYQKDGITRYNQMRPWVDQTPDPTFDPAVWQLKQIILPSGGEIHVQYEQKEYLYVQDRRAQAMVSLKSYDNSSGKAYLDVETDLNETNPADLLDQAAIIKKELIDKNEKIYFKFLYALIGTDPNLTNCQSEYIKGYSKIKDVGVDGGGLFINLNPNSLPLKVCDEYFEIERGKNIQRFGECDASEDGIDNSGGAEATALSLLTFFTPEVFLDQCDFTNAALSYLRIPLLKAKKGGGLRVKRLLMYDNSLNESVLYGSEYIYENIDPITKKINSSGVASNEPPTIREECALTVNLQKRTDPGWLEKAIAGKDRENFEGPIGETILPGASVGYSKVIKKNIHSGKTNVGFTVNEFFTYYDYPFDKSYPYLGFDKGFSHTEIKELKKEWLNIPAGLFNYSKNNLWLSQGFSFVLTDFNGKPKRTATFSGDYSFIHDPTRVTLTSSQEYDYFQPGEKIPVSNGLDMDNITSQDVGKEMEVVFEGKQVHDINDDLNVEVDGNIGFFGIFFFPFLTGIPSASYSESKLYTHVTSKVISYPAITRKVKSFQDGVYSLQENLAFSKDNGQPVLTRSYDGFKDLDLQQSLNHHGTYLAHNFVAAEQYPSLGQKAFNERKTLNNVYYYDVMKRLESIPNPGFFTEGDLLLINNEKLFNVKNIIGNNIYLIPHSKTPDPLSSGNWDVEIIRSGKSNRLNEKTGHLVVYGNEINVDYVTLPYYDIPEREDYADALNSLLQMSGGTNTLSIPINLSFNFNSNNICRKIIDSLNCHSCTPLTITTLNSYNSDGQILTTKFTINCGDRFCCFTAARSVKKQNLTNDHFVINTNTGQLEYIKGDSPNSSIILNTCQFCDATIQKPVVAGVIDASAVTYKNDFTYTTAVNNEYGISSIINPYENGSGKWRTHESYVYKEDVFHGNNNIFLTDDDNNRIYKDAGVYKQFFVFDWQNQTNNDLNKWIKVNQTNHYSPHGQAIEEQDIRGIKSSARYAYNENLPVVLIKNAGYSESSFESFEIDYGSQQVEDLHVIPTSEGLIDNVGHAGQKSLKLKLRNSSPGSLYPYFSSYKSSAITVSENIQTKGLAVMVWIKTRKNNPSQSFSKIILNTIGSLTMGWEFVWVARTGDWSLYECTIPSGGIVAPVGNTIYPELHFVNVKPITGQDEIWIDDMRVQPTESQMTCHVYDINDYKLLTTFDDQHFGLYYQYNAEGKLIRKMVETERGMKTVQETQYNTPKN
ncbi:MAG: hypothetical protein WAT21_08190 [Saprospiraceae bacterium]